MYIDIHSRRKELGLTLEQIGKLVGVSKGTVKKWENGFIKNMRRDKIMLLANALQVSPLDILNFSPSIEILQENSKLKECPFNEDYSKLIQNLFETDLLENTVIFNSCKTATCYKLSADCFDKLKKIISSGD